MCFIVNWLVCVVVCCGVVLIVMFGMKVLLVIVRLLVVLKWVFSLVLNMGSLW